MNRIFLLVMSASAVGNGRGDYRASRAGGTVVSGPPSRTLGPHGRTAALEHLDRSATTLRDRLRVLFPEASGRALKQWLETGRVHVNGVAVRRGDTPVTSADRVELGRPTAVFPAPLRLVHEDEHLIVIDKPAGLLTIATETERERTAYRLLRDWVEAQRAGRIFVVHRLDRETSGLLVFARTAAAKRALQAQFETRTPERVYVARVEGDVREDRGELTSRLVEDRSLRVRSVEDRPSRGGRAGGPGGGAPRPGGSRAGRDADQEGEPTGEPGARSRPAAGRGSERGKEAITRYRVLSRDRKTTLLELTLVTGRRGQIRAQLAEAGHPIVGDRAYGSRRDPLRRVCLHATRLAFVHPAGGRIVFQSAPPAEFGLARSSSRSFDPGADPSANRP
jgi:23S rRNA pseudouridine1911/1915/1917 synthase